MTAVSEGIIDVWEGCMGVGGGGWGGEGRGGGDCPKPDLKKYFFAAISKNGSVNTAVLLSQCQNLSL